MRAMPTRTLNPEPFAYQAGLCSEVDDQAAD